MRRIAFILATLTLTSMAIAADIACEGTRQLHIGEAPANPVLSPDGQLMLFTTQDFTGLRVFDFADESVNVIDNSRSAGFNPVFAPDGSKVYYRTATIKENLLYRDLVAYDIKERKHSRLLAPTRDEISLAGDRFGVRIRSAKGYVAGSNGKGARYAVNNFETIKVVEGNSVKEISPLPDAHTYQWASLSPRGDRILFTEPFKGVYVCDFDGKNPVRIIRKGDMPRWVNDDYIVTVVSTDDGYGVLSSKLIAVEISTGKQTQLTPDDMLVGDVSVCPEALRMAYSTIDGKMFVTNLVIR